MVADTLSDCRKIYCRALIQFKCLVNFLPSHIGIGLRVKRMDSTSDWASAMVEGVRKNPNSLRFSRVEKLISLNFIESSRRL